MEKTKNKGHDNLIPLNRKTKDEQRRIAVQGGKASGEARRAKKNVKECLKLYSEMLVTSPEVKSALKKSGVADAEEMTYSMAMALQFMTSAMRGNSQMARLVMELMGEVKQQQTNVNVTTNVNPYASLTEEELRKLADDDG